MEELLDWLKSLLAPNEKYTYREGLGWIETNPCQIKSPEGEVWHRVMFAGDVLNELRVTPVLH